MLKANSKELIIVLLSLLSIGKCVVTVKEIETGELAILHCESNDQGHRFQYWQTNNDQVIGPGNEEFNRHKYKYEVWSGTLYIKSVSTKDSGFYKCFSKQLTGPGLSIETVELIVKKDWEEVWEDDSETNSYRAAIGVLVCLILVLLGIFGFIIRRRRTKNFLVLHEDSPGVTPTRSTAKSAYNETTAPKPTTSRGRSRSPLPTQPMDSVVIDTDIKSSFLIRDY